MDIDKSSVHPGATTVQSPLSKRNVEQHGDMHPHFKKWERGVHDNVLDIDLDSLPSYPPDEEVIGIITMEDVMKELLQVGFFLIIIIISFLFFFAIEQDHLSHFIVPFQRRENQNTHFCT